MNKSGYTENLYTPNSIRTFSGRYLDFTNIREEDIDIQDIAVGLSRKIRFGGHMKDAYTVAEHSVWVSYMVPEGQELSALLHDATEAYISDIPGPIKHMLPDYCAIEDRLMSVIAKKYGIQYPFHEAVKHADKKALEYEWETGIMDDSLPCFNMEEAAVEFRDRFNQLNK